jgi:hypothetical protein
LARLTRPAVLATSTIALEAPVTSATLGCVGMAPA